MDLSLAWPVELHLGCVGDLASCVYLIYMTEGFLLPSPTSDRTQLSVSSRRQLPTRSEESGYRKRYPAHLLTIS